MEYLKGKLILNQQERCEIEGSRYYFTSGDYIELWDEEEEVWLMGIVEHSFKSGYYAIVTVKG